MTESSKALNSSVSTLKKNPSRVSHLVKGAAIRIVPAHQYASGPAKKALEEAIAKLKAKRGLNGVITKQAGEKTNAAVATGAGVGAGALAGRALGRKELRDTAKDTKYRAKARSAMKSYGKGELPDKLHTERLGQRAERRTLSNSNLRKAGRKGGKIGAAAGAALGLATYGASKLNMKKEAGESTNVVAGGVVGGAAGAALGAGLAKRKVNARLKPKTLAMTTNAGAGGHPEAIAKAQRIAGSAERKAGSLVGRAAKRFGAIGAIAGAVGSLGHSKAAGILNSRTVQQRAGQAFKVLDRSKRIDKVKIDRLKSKAKKGALVGGIVGGGVLVTRKNEQLKKEASTLVIKDGKKYRKGTVASAATNMGALNTMIRLVGARNPKSLARAAINGAMLGGGYGTVRGANRLRKGEISLSHEGMRKLTKKAAELLHHDGQHIRRGTIGSAAKSMAIGGGALGALVGTAAGPAGVAAGAASGAIVGGMYGGLYGIIRGALRSQDGESSMIPGDFDRLKARHG